MSYRTFALVKDGRVVNIAAGVEGSQFDVLAVDITDLEIQPAIGWLYDVATKTFSPPPAFSRDEAVAKAEAIARVNADAGRSRSKYLTTSPGQETTYLLKSAELDAYDATMAPVSTDYPMLLAEANATNATIESVADLVRATRAQWLQLAADIEGMRRGAIVAIENATTEADVLFAVPPSGVWP